MSATRNPYPFFVDEEESKYWKNDNIVSYLSQKHIYQIFHPILKLSNSTKRNKQIRTHKKYGIFNWNYIFGYLLKKDIFLHKNVWTMPDLKDRMDLQFYCQYMSPYWQQSQKPYCYHQLIACSSSRYVDKLMRKFYDKDQEDIKMILGTLCKQCRIEIALRLPEIMKNFGEQRDEERFARFRAVILNNCLLQYQCIKLLLSNVEWFSRMMIEINIIMSSDVTLFLEMNCAKQQTIGENVQVKWYREKCDMMEFTLRPIEMFTRCFGFFKEYSHWKFLLMMEVESWMTLIKTMLVKEAKKYNNFFQKPYIESKGFHFDIIQQIVYILSIIYYKTTQNKILSKRSQKSRKHQQFVNQLKRIQNEKNRVSEIKRNEICDILFLLFSNSERGRDFLHTQGENMKLYHKWYRQFVKECQCIKCNRRKIMIRKKKTKIFYKCKGCLMVFYCSKKCQKYDWKTYHKNICNKLKQLHDDYLAKPF